MTPSKKQLTELGHRLEALLESRSSFHAFAGFDGFVDTIQKAVSSKHAGTTHYFNTLKDFSKHLQALTGRSGQVELVTTRVKTGGNAPLMSCALGKLGVKSLCMGSMGYPKLHPIFRNIRPWTKLVSVVDPGQSQAIEFGDAKLILSELGNLKEYDWEMIKARTGLPHVRKAVGSSSLIALVDWANLEHASDIWHGLLNDVIKREKKRDRHFFFDLCDPSKKTTEDIDEVLDLIGCFSHYGKVTLGLNENEACKIWMALNGHDFKAIHRPLLPSLHEMGISIFQTMTIDTLLIHPIDRVLVFQKHKTVELKGRLVTEPVVLTGGGDHLNAGYCLGLMTNMEVEQCMLLGIATSGAYIQNGESPGLQEVISYLKRWTNETSFTSNTHQLTSAK